MNKQQVAAAQVFFLEAAGEYFSADLNLWEWSELEHGYTYLRKTGEWDGFLFVDRPIDEGNFQAGQTVVKYDGAPIWLMQRQGKFESESVQHRNFLRASLRQTYCNGIWCAGRGPVTYESAVRYPGLKYTNDWLRGRDPEKVRPPSFEGFRTLDRITETSEQAKGVEKVVYFQEIQGMLLCTIED